MTSSDTPPPEQAPKQHQDKEIKKFTGKKALIWIVGFFLVVFTVNGIMAYLALGTWGGLETENAYRKGIHYNTEIAAAEAQAESGWKIALKNSPMIWHTAPDKDIDHDNSLVVEVVWPDDNLPPVLVTALVTRAVTDIYDQEIILVKNETGLYTAPLTLPLAGQWNVTILVKRANGPIYQLKEKIFVTAEN